MMGMSHANCSHPRTPAGRAACRKQTAEFNVAVGRTPDGTVKPARRSGGTTDTRTTPKSSQRGAGGALRGRSIRTDGDMAAYGVPHVFSTVVRWAWDHGCEVKIGDAYNDREKNIRVANDRGTATMTWRDSTPHGIHGCSWRPAGTSITTRIRTVANLVRVLNGGEVE